MKRHTITLEIDAHEDFDVQGIDWNTRVFADTARLTSERVTVKAHEAERVHHDNVGRRNVDLEIL